MTEKKYATFADAPRGTMKGLRAVKPVEPPASVPDYRSTELPEHRTTAVPEPPQVPDLAGQDTTGLPDYRTTGLPKHRTTAVPKTNYYKQANEVPDHLARQLSGAESKVLEQIIRLAVGFHRDERQVRISVLQERTGYGSDKTVRVALQGLERKGVIARLGRPNNASGITYRILSYSGTPVPEYRSTPVDSTRSTPVEITGELKTLLKEQTTDDELRRSLAPLLDAAREVTGREATDWREMAEVLATELKIAAGRTNVSSAPAFLAEHLRRRLWKVNKGGEGSATATQAPGSSISKTAPEPAPRDCPDCFGTGMWYPEGFEKGVAKCTHSKPQEGGGL